MTDPYKVLGVDRRASDEEIQAAYRELVKKYHPDKYQDNPLADLAGEKMREINEAYDLLMKKSNALSRPQSGYTGSNSYYGNSSSYGSSSYYGNQSSGSGSSYYGNPFGSGTSGYGSSTSYASSGSSEFYDVRYALDRDYLEEAARILMASDNHTAEWYYLSGVLAYKQGRVDDGLTKIRMSINMSPNNQEYRNTLQRLTYGGITYRTASSNMGYGQDSCARLITCFCLSSWCSPCW